jgi:hypothetical protein
MSPQNLLPLICSLERELHESSVRHNADRLNELLHPEFKEFGRSGRSYTKAEMLSCLLAESVGIKIRSDEFVLRILGSKFVLLTYKSAQVGESGALECQALRSSIWQLESDRWQLIFHQGTPTSSD